MPIYEDQLSYEDMFKAMKSFVCGKCGLPLNLAWSAERNCYMLRCGRSLEHSTVKPIGRDPMILEILNKLKGEPLPMETTELKKQTKETMLARVDMAKFPKDLTRADRALIATVSIEYGLDPLFGELMIYQGRPYVTIDARRRMAQETNTLDGINSRPATPAERESRQVPAEDYLFVCQVWVIGASHPFEGWGRVYKAEIDRAINQAKAHGRQEDALPIVKDPAAMAEKRAEAQALRRAFHLPLPSFEEVIEGEFEEKPPAMEAPKSKTSPPKAPVSPKAPATENRLTPAQRNKIWGDASMMGYKDSDIHAIIKHKWGVESVNDLSVAQASALIDMIQKGEGIPAEAPGQLQDGLEGYVKREGE